MREVANDASPVRYDRWKAPSEDGEILIWPDAEQLLSDTRENHARLSTCDSVLLQNVAFPEVRRRMRQWLGHDDAQPLVATGHQAELHHPGVWAKNVLIDAAARKLGGRAFHFAVDTDEPKHMELRWPGGSVPLTDDARVRQAAWSGLVAPPSPAHLTKIEESLARASAVWSFKPAAPEFLKALRRQSAGAGNLPAVLAGSLHALDGELGLRYDATIVSPVCSSEPYLLFVHHVLARAGEFAAQYNDALARFRRRNKIKDPGRPMPDLKVTGEACEVPFWLDSLTDGTRSRASVVPIDGRWALRLPDGNVFRLDPSAPGWEAAGSLLAWLGRNGLRLSPRALTLTAVLRLLVADQFVHGIGGGQYDQVLDSLIHSHFGIEPPRFSVTTATLVFPEAVGQPRACLPCVVREGHLIRHSALGEEKMRLVGQIAAAARGSHERSALFHEMHRRLTVAAAEPLKDWARRLRESEERAQAERVLFDRELFYAIQPSDRLAGLVSRYRANFG